MSLLPFQLTEGFYLSLRRDFETLKDIFELYTEIIIGLSENEMHCYKKKW